MNTRDIRRSFVDYFHNRGHTRISSSSLVPGDDPTLLFTNAGMVQFKRVFQGLEQRDYTRAVTVQKCVRAGGKHNDLEQVGHTARHHTFFEMLGNFSFGDYFKREAIEYAWEWVTSEEFLGISPDRLYVTVHHTDEEAATHWRDVTGISPDRIFRLGDKDNFWQMGDTGPCGPCSEIFVDLRGARSGSMPQKEFEELGETGLLLEIWNLVFMQFDQAKDGTRTRLPSPSVDTGAGLERIAAVMQNVPSNFDNDVFTCLIAEAVKVTGQAYDPGPDGAGFRVLADHARAVAFLLADGVYPSNDGRGYVLRRILRRAVRHAYLLGRTEPTLVHLTSAVVGEMKDIYPELGAKEEHIVSVTKAEEERFFETIDEGTRRLEEMTSGSGGTVPGEEAFKLYDTYGFPIDLTTLMAEEKGWQVDREGFDQALEAQRDRSRSAGAESDAGAPAVHGSKPRDWTTVSSDSQRFVGYETTAVETAVLRFRTDGERVSLVLRENPFYAASGGQVSDVGVVEGSSWSLHVDDVVKVDGQQVVSGVAVDGFEPDGVRAIVAEQRRRDIERNHTATHLVHAALRNILGEHVRQAGSVVEPDRLRFDFSHHAPIPEEELRQIEEQVNRGIWANVDVETREMSYHDALKTGAMALFGEKYGDLVRVVDIDELSVELCGGTHVRSTGQIGLFRFMGESGVAAGVRRIEAVTGPGAYHAVRNVEQMLQGAAGILRTLPEHLAKRVETLMTENHRLEKQVEDLLKSGGGAQGDFQEIKMSKGGAVFVGESTLSDKNQVGLLLDAFRENNHNAAAVLLTLGERPGIHVAVTDDLVQRGVKAGDAVRALASLAGGKGGGRAHFASGSIGDLSRVPEMKSQAAEIIEQLLQ